ncbi:MAG: tRNA (adenosine(37)-N6)-dimethylallyltransferase MiaA [Cyclobacteriaceae bacterium]
MPDTSKKLTVILGPTALGKTKLAVSMAIDIGGEIISADSRQVYRGLDIGTGKDLTEYTVNGVTVPYHLIDICEPTEEYNVNLFQQDFTKAFEDILSRGKHPILCGGTGLYIQAVLEGFQFTSVPKNMDLRERLSALSRRELLSKAQTYDFPGNFKPDFSSTKRLQRAIEIGEFLRSNKLKTLKPTNFDYQIIGLTASRDVRRKRISERLTDRLNNGLIEEIEGLIASGVPKHKLRFFGLEYKFVTDHLDGLLNRQELFEKLEIAIHQFAKRQMTWFRKMEREGYEIKWVEKSQI